MLSARGPLILLLSALVMVLLAVFGLKAVGEDPTELGREIALPATVLGGCVGGLALLVSASVLRRLRNRACRPMARYQLVLSQADEATVEEVAAAYEALVQAVRQSFTRRMVDGQPWLALESWFLPASGVGETGTGALMLLCPPDLRGSALAALRRAYPDLTLRPDPSRRDGRALEFAQPRFQPAHVLRVRKARSWALPLGGGRQHDGSNGRSTLAGIVRQQQQAGRVSCVRWCLMPAADQLDSRAAEKLEQLAGRERNPARVDDVHSALQTAGGAMSFLELQAAIEPRQPEEADSGRGESFSELQTACRRLVSPALSQRGANHLTERLMVARQGLYRRRWARGEPPLLPDPSGATLVSPRELAALMELPSLGSEHALPLQRNTVPHLPIPTDVPRARVVELPLSAGAQAAHGDDEEFAVDGEIV